MTDLFSNDNNVEVNKNAGGKKEKSTPSILTSFHRQPPVFFPQVDIGQIEGAFVQGLGYYLTERVDFDEHGRLTSNGTWMYKPPGVRDIPLEFNVTLVPPPPPSSLSSATSSGGRAAAGTQSKTKSREEGEKEGGKDGLVLSSKATGEPPYMLASSAYFGLISAIREGRREWREGGKDGEKDDEEEEEEEEIALSIPATIEERVKTVDVPVAAFVLT